MSSKIVILCSVSLLIQTISAQYLGGYGNFQNGVSSNSYASNIAQNNIATNLNGANNLANVYSPNNLAANDVTNNLVSTANALAGGNMVGQTLTSNNIIGPNYSTLAANSLSNAANIASSAISSTAGLLEGITASNGGLFSVTSTSPIVPTGLSIYSDNLLIEGPVTVSGQLPFLSAVAIEGTVPTSGQGVARCGCGDGNIGIVNELNNAGLYGGLGRPGLGRY